jgi:hypothetical protein
VNFNKIRDTLGFAPDWSVEQGVRQVIEAFETGRVQDYRDAKYSNVKFLTDEGAYLLVRQNGWAHELIRESSALPLAAAAAGD